MIHNNVSQIAMEKVVQDFNIQSVFATRGHWVQFLEQECDEPAESPRETAADPDVLKVAGLFCSQDASRLGLLPRDHP